MITMQFVIGTLAKKLHYVTESDLLSACGSAEARGEGMEKTCYYEAYVRKHVFEHLGMRDTGFRPAESTWASIAPTWEDDVYRHEGLQVRKAEPGSHK